MPYPIIITADSTVASGVGTPMCPDTFINPFNIGIGAYVMSGSPTFSIEHTFVDVMNGAAGTLNSNTVWIANSGLTGQTGTCNGNYAYPVSAIRIHITGGSGTVAAYILQAGTR
jgi:hypothetical protein